MLDLVALVSNILQEYYLTKTLNDSMYLLQEDWCKPGLDSSLVSWTN